MHNFDDIEQRWQKYNRKRQLRRLTYVLPPFLVLLISIGLYVWLSPPKEQPKPAVVVEKKVIAPQPFIPQNNTTTASLPNPPLPTDHNITLPPQTASPSAVTQVKTQPQTKETPTVQPVQTQKITLPKLPTSVNPASPLPTQPKVQDAHKPKQITLSSSSQLSIQGTTAADILPLLEEKFAKNPTYAVAITAAKENYDRGNFPKASEWSLKANELDKDKPDSWILYAKSVYKTGQKGQAVKVLETYLRSATDSEARGILEKMRNGSF